MPTPKKNINETSKLQNIIQEQIEKIRLDNTSGSAELTKQAADILLFLVDIALLYA